MPYLQYLQDQKNQDHLFDFIGDEDFYASSQVEYGLIHYKNYGFYENMIRTQSSMTIYVPKDITLENINDHIDNIYNILKDGIETDYVHNCKVTLQWEKCECRISLVDFWLSLIMWDMILKTNNPIRPKHIFLGSRANKLTGTEGHYFPWELRQKDIQTFINNFVLTLENKITIGNTRLNEIIADAIWKYSYLEHFYYYLGNTVNNEDDIDLMRASPEFYQSMHVSLYGVPIEDVKNKGLEITNNVIDIIKDSERYLGYEHGLTNSFRADEGINPRQYKEAMVSIGTKPNGKGGIFPYIIDKNFKTSGVNDPLSFLIESSTARTAQILSKINVGDSGEFARILGLNNSDTILNPDPNYRCGSRNFIRFEIKSPKHLSMIKNRYFRYNSDGMDFLIDYKDQSMVGKTILLHSPMTCSSNAFGHGICCKCYGNLYYTNYDINIGKIAAEMLSEQITQRLLSAKHLLETLISNIKWSPLFKSFFTIDLNSIKLSEEFDDEDELKKYLLIIDPNDVQLVSDEEDAVSIEDAGDDESDEETTLTEEPGNYNEYITSFIIRQPDGSEIVLTSEEQQELYISVDLNNIIRKKAFASEDKVAIPLSSLMDSNLFYIKINNNEMSKTMKDIQNIIDKAAVTEKLTKEEALQNLVDLIVSSGLTIDSIHLEVLLSNQIVDPDNIYKKPNWNKPDALYKIFTLNKSLTNNPSIIISMLYKDLNKVLYNPLSFSKHAPSFFDLFFMEKPQQYLSDDLISTDTSSIRNPEEKIQLYKLTSNGDREKEIRERLESAMTSEQRSKIKSHS